MGYYANAFVLTERPNFDAVAAAMAAQSMRGYQHLQRAVWLLDIWHERRGEHVPFQDSPDHKAVPRVATDLATQQFLNEFEALTDTLADEEEVYGLDEARLAIAVACHAQVPVFFLKYDDEAFDFACHAEPQSLTKMRCRIERFNICFDAGSARVEPNYFPEDGEDELPDGVIESLSEAVAWPIAPPVAIEGGLPLAGNALSLWPSEAGDPEALLGWDAFASLDEDYRLVFERRAKTKTRR